MRTTTSLLALAMILCGPSLRAQDVAPATPKPVDRHAERMIKDLELVDPQAAEVRSINEKYAKELHALKQQEPPREEMKSGRKEILLRRDEELKAVLTNEQWTRLLELREQWKAERKAERQVDMPHNE